MMNISWETQRGKYPMLAHCEAVPSLTLKPVDCAFSKLKNRLEVLRFGLRLHHEDGMVRLCYLCDLQQNMSFTYWDTCVDDSARVGDLPFLEDDIVTVESYLDGSNEIHSYIVLHRFSPVFPATVPKLCGTYGVLRYSLPALHTFYAF